VSSDTRKDAMWLAVGSVVSDAVGVCDIGDWVGSIVDVTNGDRVGNSVGDRMNTRMATTMEACQHRGEG
jgi:hypothetical protein